jgi:hypothetical protein
MLLLSSMGKTIAFLWLVILAFPPSAHASWKTSYLFVGENFKPLMAAPREPRFFSGYQHLSSDGALDSFNGALVGLGENFGLIRWRDSDSNASWDIGVTGGLVSLFKLNQKSTDLINSDFLVGLTASYRSGGASFRSRIFHQSSHLGDEFLLKNDEFERINYSFEALDITGSRKWGPWRAYAGGAYMVRVKPEDIDRASVQFGGEYSGIKPLWKGAYLKAGVNTELVQEQSWSPNVHAVLGIEFGKTRANTRRFGMEFDAYDGYSPWGQFYDVRVRSFGSTLYIRF